jgi:hypothetical protein
MLVSGKVTLAVSVTAANTAGERDAARAGGAGATAAKPMTTMSTTRNTVTRNLVGVGAVRFWAMLATPLRALCILLVKRARSIGAAKDSWTVLQAACRRFPHFWRVGVPAPSPEWAAEPPASPASAARSAPAQSYDSLLAYVVLAQARLPVVLQRRDVCLPWLSVGNWTI